MKRIFAALALFLSVTTQTFAASTSYQATLGSGAAFGAWCVGGTGSACTGGVFWPSTVIANSGGVELFTNGNAAFVQFPSAQAVNATLQASATTAIGKVDPNTIATWGLAAIGAGTAPTNAMVGGGVYNSGGVTLTTGQSAALQFTSAGSLHTTVDNTNANGPAAASASSPVTPSNLPPGAAAINTNQVSVAATAGGTLIVAARTGVAGTGRVSATVCNTGTTAVYIGNTGLTTATGQYLAGVAGACLTLNTTAAIYGIVATGTETVAYSETY